jgi:hypothetical protein
VDMETREMRPLYWDEAIVTDNKVLSSSGNIGLTAGAVGDPQRRRRRKVARSNWFVKLGDKWQPFAEEEAEAIEVRAYLTTRRLFGSLLSR